MGALKQVLGAATLAVAVILSVLSAVSEAVKEIEGVLSDQTEKLSAHIDASNRGADCFKVGQGWFE